MKIQYFDIPDIIIKEFGRRLKEERLAQNKKRETLSEETGLSISTIERIERGEDVKFSNIIKMLQGLGLVENLNVVVREEQIDLQRLYYDKPKRKRAKDKKENSGTWIWGEETGST